MFLPASRHALLIGSAFITVAVMGCGAVTEASSTDFTVHVDSITGPNAVSGGIAWDNFLWGTVGPSGCTTFKELRTTRVTAQIDVTVVGERVAGASCRSGTLTLNGMVLRLEPIIPNNFMIVVHQPDGSTLTRRIYGE